jgi:hypothetical protein
MLVSWIDYSRPPGNLLVVKLPESFVFTAALMMRYDWILSTHSRLQQIILTNPTSVVTYTKILFPLSQSPPSNIRCASYIIFDTAAANISTSTNEVAVSTQSKHHLDRPHMDSMPGCEYRPLHLFLFSSRSN